MAASALDVIAGAGAGLTATAPMTAVMAALFPQLPPEDQHPLPPRHITERALETVGADDDLAEPQKQELTWVAHFGYGAAAGAVYGLLHHTLPGPAPLRGIAYGLAVWAGSYLGWLPAMRMYPSATEESAERNGLMIAAHVVWGATLGTLTELLSGEEAARESASQRNL